jgi:hypothetical protein
MLESHLTRLQEHCYAVVEPMLMQNSEMEERLRELDRRLASSNQPVRSTDSQPLPSLQDAFAPQGFLGGRPPMTAPTGALRKPESTPPATNVGARMSSTPDPVTHHPPVEEMRPPLITVAFGSGATSPAANNYASPLSAHSISISASDTRGKFGDSLGAAYDLQYKNNGFAMAWSALHLAFSREYDCSSPKGTSAASPTVAAADVVRRSAASEGSDDAVSRFQAAFQAQVADIVADAEKLKERFAECETPLRSGYVAACLHSKVKTNSGVMQLLSGFKSERDVLTFSLGDNLVGETRIMPLLPLFSRMYRMHTLDLSNNGLKNRAIQALATVLTGHQSLTSLDVSGNPFSRVGGKALLALVLGRPLLVTVRAEHTQMEAALRDRIYHAAARNAAREEGQSSGLFDNEEMTSSKEIAGLPALVERKRAMIVSSSTNVLGHFLACLP